MLLHSENWYVMIIMLHKIEYPYFSVGFCHFLGKNAGLFPMLK